MLCQSLRAYRPLQMSLDMLASVERAVNPVSDSLGRKLGYETSFRNQGSAPVFPLAKKNPARNFFGSRRQAFSRTGLDQALAG
jgi:hypothetical protein